jgi:hypothetical protein
VPRDRKRIHRPEPERASAIRAERRPAPALRFSFKYLQTDHASFTVLDRDGEYFRVLLARLRELSSMQVTEFRSHHSKTLRIHRISFCDGRVSVRGFAIPGGADFDEEAWQFSLSANEHGRVHGFLIDDTFYVRWLDPDHRMYPGAN